MALQLHDSATHTTRPFEPLVPGKVGMYVCGATVQSSPHIGHLRTALAFDVLRRWMERSGYEVTHVRNVTDIDDKILSKSAEAGRPWWAHAYIYEQEFTAAYDALHLLRPTYEPRATGHIPEMIELTQRLIDRGHAYVGEPGNVYFDVNSYAQYGALTNQRVTDMEIPDESQTDKRGPHDFALLKAPHEGEPETARWDTPWGASRPGWHLECSAMAHRYLGESFDIHGGGLDLRFPHHENEQAQSRAAGFGFAQYWLHSAWVTQAGEKMSKSLGNTLLVSEILSHTPAVVVRLALVAAHYRSMVEFSDTTTAEAASNWERFAGFVNRAIEMVGEVPAEDLDAIALPEEFVAAMDDDLGTPAALAVVHEYVKRGNSAIAAADAAAVKDTQVAVRAMLAVLGLDPVDWQGADSSSADSALDTVLQMLLAERAQARADKNWARADEIRDSLAQAGIIMEDRADGATWHLA